MAAPTNTSGLLQVDNLSSTSHNFTLSFTPTVGRDLVFTLHLFNSGGGTISAVTMGGTSATLLEEGTDGSSRQQIWIAQNISTATTTVSLTLSNGFGNYVSGGIDEWGSGVLTNPALDTGTDNSASGNSATPAASTAATTSQASTIIYSVVGPRTAVANNNITGPTSWNTVWTEQDSSNHQAGRGAWIEETTTGTKTATYGMTSGQWGVSIVALKITPASPTINSQPADATIYDGETANFSVTATSSGGTLTYQWQVDTGSGFNNVSDGSGATSSSYTTAAKSVNDSGDLYRCVVSDDNGSTNTNSATLTVNAAARIGWFRA